ncbi:hypothetical protein EVAR_39285_1 [Eumeta japonica]|uniref:Uncharacterized protein n=1 Tax=Eumeta variegata TaxID=151549 RepID=A0A4C1VVN4_EUMVA|nr:hypothetical protein EVAR_39285_1 [Eumeta japonica]
MGKENSVSFSPGLANLTNGSTSKTSLKSKTFDPLEQIVIEGESCRMKIKQEFDNRGQGKASTSKKTTNDSPKSSPKPTKVDLRNVNPSIVMLVNNPKDHMRNAFLEFAALTIALKDVTQTRCKNILRVYKKGDINQLKQNWRKTKAPYTTISCPNIYLEMQDKTWWHTMTHGDWIYQSPCVIVSRRTGNKNYRQGQIQNSRK